MSLSGNDEGAEVDVEVEFEAHLEQQATLDEPRWDLGGADRAQEQGIQSTPFLDDLVGQDGSVAEVTVATEVVVDGFELDPCRSGDLEALRDDLGSDAVATDDADSMCHWSAPGPAVSLCSGE